MRTETEMLNLILSTARNDERIRLVGMNGSRANAKAPKDQFQDYDIVYLVTDMEPFIQDRSWIDIFGKRVILQTPEAMTLFPPSLGGWFSYLMLFEDGSRIDLTLIPLVDLDRYLKSDKLTMILLDKDNRAVPLPAPGDEDHWVQRPSLACFDDCCNEFWWVSTYVAKGLCRKELLYAADHLNHNVRPELLRMLSWQAGIETGFSVSVGKSCKYLDRYLPAETWKRLLSTYRNDSAENLWQALLECQALFREASRTVADRLDYTYPEYDEKVSRYIQSLQHLPHIQSGW